MEENDEKKLIDALKGGTPSPDFSRIEAKADSGRSPRGLRVWIPVFSAVLALVVAIPVTWSLTRKATQEEDAWSAKAGAGASNDAFKYLANNFTNYYGASIGSLIASDVIYADFYYGRGLKTAEGQDTSNYVVVSLHSSVAVSFSVSVNGSFSWDSKTLLAYGTVPGDSFIWAFEIKAPKGETKEASHAFDLKPCQNIVLSSD